MNTYSALQELGLSQMRVINRFFDLKVEVLFALLRHRDIYSLSPVQRNFSDIGRTLDKLAVQVAPVAGESHAAQMLRFRGCNALRRGIRQAVNRTREAVLEMLGDLNRESYTADEWFVIQETVDSLAVILDSNIYLLENSQPPEEVM